MIVTIAITITNLKWCVIEYCCEIHTPTYKSILSSHLRRTYITRYVYVKKSTNCHYSFQTTASMQWVLHLLTEHPHTEQKLYQEINEVLGTQETITSQHISKMVYLKAFVKEMFR